MPSKYTKQQEELQKKSYKNPYINQTKSHEKQ